VTVKKTPARTASELIWCCINSLVRATGRGREALRARARSNRAHHRHIANQPSITGRKPCRPSRFHAAESEQSHQHQCRDRQDRNLRLRRRDVQTFDGAQHRNRRGDGAVRKEQRRAQDSSVPYSLRRGLSRACSPPTRSGPAPAFALVVGVQYYADIFEQDDQDKDQKISERTPSTCSGVTAMPGPVKQAAWR